VTVRVDEIWRLHWEDDPRDPERYARGKFRFDAPAGEFRVTYGNEDEYACFGEVYGDQQSIAPKDRDRKLSVIVPRRPLQLVALDDGTVLKALDPKLDGRISTDLDYARTREWSLALHGWYAAADGLRYTGRHAVTRLNYCLYIDRCGDALDVDSKGSLVDLRDLVMRAADAWNLAPRLFEPRDRSRW
jgi:RES domain-containing protein